MASKKNTKPAAKPTLAQAYKAAQKSTVADKPTPGSAAANRAQLANVGSSIVKFFASGGISGNSNSKPKEKVIPPIPKAEQADIIRQAKAKDKKANTARMVTDAKYDKVSAPVVAVVVTTAKAAKPYAKLKQAPREAARRAYVQKQLDRLGIKPTAAGKPRSAKEKAARAKARATWDKKNKFVPKSLDSSPSDAAKARRPEA